ncbi:MAG TPA: hypothetical protein PK970_05565, partial [Hyphomicrobiaceae bacterium]|nr:hypothetical protein [Hyphomicrobiaceae bacterium]
SFRPRRCLEQAQERLQTGDVELLVDVCDQSLRDSPVMPERAIEDGAGFEVTDLEAAIRPDVIAVHPVVTRLGVIEAPVTEYHFEPRLEGRFADAGAGEPKCGIGKVLREADQRTHGGHDAVDIAPEPSVVKVVYHCHSRVQHFAPAVAPLAADSSHALPFRSKLVDEFRPTW